MDNPIHNPVEARLVGGPMDGAVFSLRARLTMPASIEAYKLDTHADGVGVFVYQEPDSE